MLHLLCDPRELHPLLLMRCCSSARAAARMDSRRGVEEDCTPCAPLTHACLMLESHGFRPKGAEMAEKRAKNGGELGAAPLCVPLARVASGDQHASTGRFWGVPSDFRSCRLCWVSHSTRNRTNGATPVRRANRKFRTESAAHMIVCHVCWGDAQTVAHPHSGMRGPHSSSGMLQIEVGLRILACLVRRRNAACAVGRQAPSDIDVVCVGAVDVCRSWRSDPESAREERQRLSARYCTALAPSCFARAAFAEALGIPDSA